MRSYQNKLMITPASITFHHTYQGGLLKHILEVVDLAFEITGVLFRGYDAVKEYPPFRDKVILVSLIHDMSKIMVYKRKLLGWSGSIKSFEYNHYEWVIVDWAEKVGYELDDLVKEAIRTHHGGWSPKSGLMQHLLSAVIHSADLISSRIEKG